MRITDGGRSVYLDEVEEFTDNFTGSPKETRNLSNFTDNYGRHVVGQMRSVYDHKADRCSKVEQVIPERAVIAAGEVRDWTEAVETGRMSVEEFERRLSTQAGPALRRLRQEAALMVDTEEQAWAEVDMTPAEWQRAQARRAGELFRTGRALPRLTPGVLDGTEFPEFR